MTTLESLKGINSYPIPYRTLESVAVRHGLSLNVTVTAEVVNGRNYKLACADLLKWLSKAPNITLGGQSYSFTDEWRKQFLIDADALEAEAMESSNTTRYGYKGSRL